MYKQTAVSRGGKEIFSSGKGAVKRWDESAWKAELKTKLARLAVCGEVVLCFDIDETGKKILCWINAGGEWKGPDVVVEEETPVFDFAVQRYAPADFVPVAYNCWSSEEAAKKGRGYGKAWDLKPWIQVLKVPAR